MVIQKLTAQNLCDVNKAANQPFPLIGRIKPSFQNGVWSYEEELQEPCRWKSYPADEMDYSVYFQREEKAGFLAYSPTECIGQILLRKDWNRYAFIEDICVCQTARGQGVGTASSAGPLNGRPRPGYAGWPWKPRTTTCWHAVFMPNAAFKSGR